jgi:hypothetical protein
MFSDDQVADGGELPRRTGLLNRLPDRRWRTDSNDGIAVNAGAGPMLVSSGGSFWTCNLKVKEGEGEVIGRESWSLMASLGVRDKTDDKSSFAYELLCGKKLNSVFARFNKCHVS